MWRYGFVLCLCVAIVVGPASAQQWTGRATATLTGGYQTNTYLDPVVGLWDPSFTPAFAAITPQITLTRDARRLRIDLTSRSQLYPGRGDRPQFLQGYVQARYRLGPDWTLGALGGASRFRRNATQDSWWMLPSVRWTPSSATSIALQAGLTRRVERALDPPRRQTSGLASLRVVQGLGNRWRSTVRLYWSDGRTSTTDLGLGGTGASIAATYWPSGTVALTARVGAERLRYDQAGTTGGVRDRIGRAALEAEWTVRRGVSLAAYTGALRTTLASDGGLRTDVRAALSVRLSIRRVLGGSPAPPTPRRQVCAATDSGLRFRVPYTGDGTPHVTGAFSDWSLPGRPLSEVENGLWTTTIDLPPGRYAYRIRVVDGDEARWLSLPSYARTEADAFGGVNGVCTVP